MPYRSAPRSNRRVAVAVLAAMVAPLLLVTAAAAEPLSSSPRDFTSLSGVTLFVTTLADPLDPDSQLTELWRTDGTPGGTFELATCGAACDPRVEIVAAAPTKVFFTAWDEGGVWQLWATDGTQAGTLRLTDFVAEGAPPGRDAVLWAPQQGLLYFVVEEPAGFGFWVSDGTREGTTRLRLFAAALSAGPFALTEHAGTTYFLLAPLEPNTGTYELWRSDGTAATTRLVTPLEPRFRRESSDQLLSLPGGLLLLPQGSYDGPRLWTSDGTAAGTVPLSATGLKGVNTYSAQLSIVGDLAYFLAFGDGDYQLWRSDGTAAGTVRLTDVPGGISFLFDFDPWPWQDGVVFSLGKGVWKSDGTPAGTGLLFEGHPVNGVYDLAILAVDPGRIYFVDRSGLWVSDGTRAGSHRVSGVRVYGGSDPAVLATGDKLFFLGVDFSDYPQLWVLDKASERVERLTRLAGVPAFDLSWVAGRVGEELLLPADDGIHGLEPWISDGTPEGTRLLADLAAGTDGLASCLAGDRVLCLQRGRLRVTVDWHDPRQGTDGVGHAIAAGGAVRTGYFRFFGYDNIELAVKLLDGSRINGHYWTFYGALTDLEYDLTIVDTVSGEHRRYHNAAGEICGAGDTRSLPASSATTSAAATPVASPAATGEQRRGGRMAFPSAAPQTRALPRTTEPCVADGHTLCLLGGRFRARVRWRDQHNGGSGSAGAVRFGDRSGLFSFFHPENVELVVKALDGRDVDGHFWIFFASLTDVGYTLTVEDLTEGGAVRRYVNPPGEICGRADTAAFP